MDSKIGGVIGTGISVTSTLLSTTELEQWIGIICSIIGAVVTIVSAIIIPLIKRIKKAKSNDGKIDASETKEIITETKKDIESIIKENNNNE